MSIMASIQRVCPALQAEYGDEPVPVKRFNEAVATDCGCSVDSVLVSDRCYNRHNDGSSVKLTDPKLFKYVRRGFYKYVGPSYPYSGPIYQKPKGSKKELIIGERLNGVLVINNSRAA